MRVPRWHGKWESENKSPLTPETALRLGVWLAAHNDTVRTGQSSYLGEGIKGQRQGGDSKHAKVELGSSCLCFSEAKSQKPKPRKPEIGYSKQGYQAEHGHPYPENQSQ